MSTQDNVPVTGFSANSKSLKSFQLQQKLRSLMLVAVIGVPLLGGIIAYQLYSRVIRPAEEQKASQELANANSAADAQNVSNTTTITDPAATTGNTSSPTTATPSPSATPKSSSTKPNTGSSATTAPAGMPAGVTVALNSIEQNGIRNNPYVAADTSSVPEGTVVKADRASWKAYSESMGTVTGTISIQGQVHTGSVTFELVSGSWKATGYSIDS